MSTYTGHNQQYDDEEEREQEKIPFPLAMWVRTHIKSYMYSRRRYLYVLISTCILVCIDCNQSLPA